MRAALVVHRVLPDAGANLETVLKWIDQAAAAGARLVLFAEAALTGLINDDDPQHDLPLGQPIPGPVTAVLGRRAEANAIWLAIGLLEREGDSLYDSALLFRPDGEIGLHYRRIQPQWHGGDADPLVYRQGTDLPAIDTPLGRMAFLLCGDLFDDDLVLRARDLRPDWLLFPFARCFADGSVDQGRWDEEEQPAYVERVRMVGATALMANYLAAPDLLGGAFGGAMAVTGDGTVIDRLPLGQEGMLLVDLGGAERRACPEDDCHGALDRI